MVLLFVFALLAPFVSSVCILCSFFQFWPLFRLKPGIDFQYMINPKGSSPPEILGTGYKTVLKPALVAHAEENKRICVSNLEELHDLQKQLQRNVKVLEGERNNISSLQAKNDEVSPAFLALHYIYSI